MKKSLLAFAVLGAASGFAMAASNVTLYGVIDTGVKAEKVGGVTGNKISMSTGFRSGARWGLKGVEDLGNGYSVGFVLEQGFSSNNGATANGYSVFDSTGNAKTKYSKTENGTFNRESKLYVQGGFGQLGFGRLGSLAGGAQTNSILTGWALGTSYSAGSWTNLAIGNGRVNNAIAYVSPVMAGLKIAAMYSNGTTTDTNQWSGNHHYYGIGAQYSFGGFTNSLIFEATDGKGSKATGSIPAGKTEPIANKYTEAQYLINLGIGYKVGIFTPQFAYQYNWQDGGNKDNVFGLSTAVEVAGGTAKIGARYLLGKDDSITTGEDKRRAWTVNAAYEYPISKRTLVYGYAGYADGSKLLDKDTLVAKDKASINYNGYQVAVGLQHSF
jgi:predicted porin